MTRRTRTHLPVRAKRIGAQASAGGPGGGGPENPQQVMTKEDFARHLFSLIKARGWSQSELGRRAGMTRASVSDYVNARVEPTPISVQKMARAFGISEHEVMPNQLAKAIRDDAINFEMKASDGNPNLVRLRMDRLVSLETASKISTLLFEDARHFDNVVNGH
jgi:transcriptional regulator with XRE-family HTH domain